MVVHFYPAVDIGIGELVKHPVDVRGVGINGFCQLFNGHAVTSAKEIAHYLYFYAHSKK